MLKQHAVYTGNSVSEIIESAVTYQLLEDIHDVELLKERLASNEPPITHEEMVAQLKAEGLLSE